MRVKRWMKRPRSPRLATARRRGRVFGRVLAALAACLTLAGGLWLGSVSGPSVRFFREARFFQIRSVEIHGIHRLTREGILQRMALGRRASVLGIRLGDVRQRLLDDPWIREVSLHKIFPDALWVDIVEREAVAVIPVGSRLSLVDTDGVLLGDPPGAGGALPRLDGLDPRALSAGDPRERSRLQSALDVLAEIKKGPLAPRIGDDVRLLVSRMDGISVDLPRAGVGGRLLRITLGDGGIDEQIRRFVQVEGDLERRMSDEDIVGNEVDLRFDRQVIVRPLAGSVGRATDGRGEIG